MGDFHRLANGYIGKSKSHERFVRRSVLLKVISFTQNKYSEQSFNDIQQGFKNQPEATAIASVWNPISKTQFQASVLRKNEFDLIAAKSDDLKAHMFRSTYCDIWRVFDDFRIDLCCEIGIKIGKPEFERRKLSYPEHLEKAFKKIGLSSYPNQLGDWNQKNVKYIVALARFRRNAIEHNDGFVDTKALDRWTDPLSSAPYNDGDSVEVGPKEVGELIAFVETFAEDMDKRAIELLAKIADD